MNALLALMCFHSSRFEARLSESGEIILYDDQDEKLWNKELIEQGEYFLNRASTGNELSKYHLEAAIAWWHTCKADTKEKWENILQLYNKLLQMAYSPIAALNRTYALAKSKRWKQQRSLKQVSSDLKITIFIICCSVKTLSEKQTNQKTLHHLELALKLAKADSDKKMIMKKIYDL